MINVELNIKLHPNQRLIHESPARFKVIKAGKRFGKSKLAIYEILKKAGMKPNGIFWYIAPTYRQAKDIAWAEISWMLPKQLVRRSVENELTKELINGAVIKLKGADNPDSLRGIRIDGVVFDEAAYTDEDIWPTIISGQLMGSQDHAPGWAYFISSPNKEGHNWFTNFHMEAKRKMEMGDKEWAAWKFTILDNPTLLPVEIEKLKDMNSDDKWQLEYLAEESAHAGQLVSEFDYSIHVGEEAIDESWALVRGLDWGIAHPTGCLWLNVDDVAKQVYISDEYKKSGMTIEESAAIIKRMTGERPVEWSVIDPSTAKRNSQTGRTDKDEFARYGVHCAPGDNRDRGYDIMKMFFKKNMIKIHPKCKNLIYELKNVQWGDDEGEDLMDCLRYALVRVHDLMFGGKLPEGKSLPKGQAKFTPEYLKERRECSLENKFMFPDEQRVTEMGWIKEEAMAD